MRKKTFEGPGCRVLLAALDRVTPAAFLVYFLPSYYHPSTAFRVIGRQCYFGEDVRAAWEVVKQHCPAAEWPRSWDRFIGGKPLIEIL